MAIFVAPGFSMLRYRDLVFCLFSRQSINICVNSYFDPNVEVNFPRTIKATVMILGSFMVQ